MQVAILWTDLIIEFLMVALLLMMTLISLNAGGNKVMLVFTLLLLIQFTLRIITGIWSIQG